MVHVVMSQRSPKGANKQVAHPVVVENRHEEVIAPGTAAAGYLGRQILGSSSTHGECTGGKSVDGLYLLFGFRTTVIPHFE